MTLFEGTPKEAAVKLLDETKTHRVQFPKLMDDAKRMQVCGAQVVSKFEDFKYYLMCMK